MNCSAKMLKLKTIPPKSKAICQYAPSKCKALFSTKPFTIHYIIRLIRHMRSDETMRRKNGIPGKCMASDKSLPIRPDSDMIYNDINNITKKLNLNS